MSISLAHSGGVLRVPYYTHKRGHEMWRAEDDNFIPVHRLQAVAEWGLDAVKDKHVHHKNGIPWDNRIENLELVSNAEHQRKHKKIVGQERREIAERYENTDESSYQIAEDYPICAGTVRQIHEEYFGDDGGEKAT